MKKRVFAIAIVMGCLIATGCNDKGDNERADKKNEISTTQVPKQVVDAFTAKYPGASNVIWETAHEDTMDTYKVKFKKDGTYMKAEFGEDGAFVKEKLDE